MFGFGIKQIIGKVLEAIRGWNFCVGTAAFSSFDFLVIIDLMSGVGASEAFKEAAGKNISRIDHPRPPNFRPGNKKDVVMLNREAKWRIIALSSKFKLNL